MTERPGGGAYLDFMMFCSFRMLIRFSATSSKLTCTNSVSVYLVWDVTTGAYITKRILMKQIYQPLNVKATKLDFDWPGKK